MNSKRTEASRRRKRRYRYSRPPRMSVRPTRARQLVALWARQRLVQAGPTPLHFVTFCRDIELFTQRPIGRKRALQTWKSALQMLESSRVGSALSSEITIPEAERLIQLEGVSTWPLLLQLNVLSEASALAVSEHANFDPAYFAASPETQRYGSALGALATEIEQELRRVDGSTR